jgi:hypothetical protein
MKGTALVLIAACWLALSLPANARRVVQLAELSDGVAFDEFGLSVAVSGDTVVVGVPKPIEGGEAAAYVFVKSGTTWKQVAELQDGVSNDELGFSVSISGDANTIVAGAPNSASDGTAYVFVKPAGGWQDTPPTATLTVAGGQVHFADSVAISNDGATIVAGAEGDGSPGAAYVFVKPASGWQSTNVPTATLSATGSVMLGNVVAMGGDTIVAGSVGFDVDAAYVFVKPPAGWQDAQPTATLRPSDNNGVDYFGTSVAISGNTVVVGAPFHPNFAPGTAYVFVEAETGWRDMTQTAELSVATDSTLELGTSVAVEGNVVLAGAPFDQIGQNDEQGAVFGYVEPPTGWANSSTPVGSVTSSDNESEDRFGDAIAISGTLVVIGAPYQGGDLQGAVYIFAAQ